MDGVSYVTRDKRWVVQISNNGKRYAWRFRSKAEAKAARTVAEDIFNYHSNHGRPTDENGRRL